MSASLPEPELELGATSAPAIVSGGLWTLLSRVIPQAQLLVLSIVVARYLGPDEMGRQSYIAFVALTLVQAATAGLPGAVSRFVGELLGARGGGAVDLSDDAAGGGARRGARDGGDPDRGAGGELAADGVVAGGRVGRA